MPTPGRPIVPLLVRPSMAPPLTARVGALVGEVGAESPTLWLRWHEPRLGRRLGRLGLESPTLFLRRHDPWLGGRLARLGLESWMGVVIKKQLLAQRNRNDPAQVPGPLSYSRTALNL